MNPSNASSFRRMACGLCLLAGPACILVASIVDPSDSGGDSNDDARRYLQSIKDDPDGTQLSTALFIVGLALLVVGLIGFVHVIRERGVVLANVGGTLAIFGGIFFVALVTTTIADLNAAEHLDIETARKLNEDVEDYWSAYVVFIPAIFGSFLGWLLLAAALIRSRLTHVAAGVMLILGIVMIPVGEDSDVLGVVGGLLLLAGFGMVGLKILGMTDEQWDGRAPLGAGPEAPAAAGPPPAV
ncbi:MAG TPA: hypothetical protein VF712_09655 [Thermoleophilaceae bacterium]|jgi:hypothetical protein